MNPHARAVLAASAVMMIGMPSSAGSSPNGNYRHDDEEPLQANGERRVNRWKRNHGTRGGQGDPGTAKEQDRRIEKAKAKRQRRAARAGHNV